MQDSHLALAIGFREVGYLFLARTAEGREVLERNTALQRGLGAGTEMLGATGALQRRFPWLHTGDITAASFGPTGEGWFDGFALLQHLKGRAVVELGAVMLRGDVVGFDSDATQPVATAGGCSAAQQPQAEQQRRICRVAVRRSDAASSAGTTATAVIRDSQPCPGCGDPRRRLGCELRRPVGGAGRRPGRRGVPRRGQAPRCPCRRVPAVHPHLPLVLSIPWRGPGPEP
jgi:hypothetical protein